MRQKKQEEIIVKEEIQEATVSAVLRDNFMPYAMSVIVSRALPDLADGLKPSHRKFLYTMYQMGLLSGNRTKSANIAARTMLLNPHSDSSNYEAMVRFTQNNETLLTPIVDGKGSFGKHYSRDISAAASRYTEAKLMPVAKEFFSSINKNTVDFVDNYDSTRKEPTQLPVTFPNILANPTEGIAVGMASSIPSFNLNELCDATILRIQHPKQNVMDVMPGPDFTTGAYLLYEKNAMEDAYQNGRGSIKLRAKYVVDKKNRVIEVMEIPYTTTAEAIIEGVIAAIKSGKINEVSDIRNEIDINGFKIAIDYKRGVDPDQLMAKLYKITKLQDSYAFNMTVLVNGNPRVLGVTEILDEWLNWRRSCVKRELQFDYDKKEKELHLLEGLAKVLLNIDKAIKIIRNSEKDEEVIQNLMKGFKIDQEQAEYIAEIKLRNLNKDYIIGKTSSIEKLKDEISILQKQMGSEKEINKLIIQALKDVKKKYGIPRKTEIVEFTQTDTIDIDQTVPDYPVRIYVTKEHYIKKIALTSLKTSPEIKTKDGDEIIWEHETNNDKELLLFTDKCNVYKVLLNDIKNSKPSELGDFANNLANMEENESVLFATTSDAGQNVVIGFQNGKVAKYPLSVYETKQNRKKLVNAFSDKSAVIGVDVINEDEEFCVLSNKNKLLIVHTKDIPLKTTKTTQGIQAMRLPKDAEVAKFAKLTAFNIENRTGFGYKALPAAGGKYSEQPA